MDNYIPTKSILDYVMSISDPLYIYWVAGLFFAGVLFFYSAAAGLMIDNISCAILHFLSGFYCYLIGINHASNRDNYVRLLLNIEARKW